ncbi:MAG: transcription termination/antitermination factor NusG [Microscillaceae bacterium]|nr:transcription termination/antitermination factor NusG [Microscillaceae bacterium]
MSEMKLNWYVVRAISGQEKKIKSYLETEINRRKIGDFIPQILIPSEKVYEMRNGKKYQRERTFLPGYILIQADLTHGEVEPLITNIPGIIGFLSENHGTSKQPIPIRQSDINRILGRVDDANSDEPQLEASFIVGEAVKVIDGPFSGFVGTVEEVFEERKKLNVTVKIFGRNTPMELNYMQVEKQE